MFIEQALYFEEQLYQLINNCGLTVDEAYYIVMKSALELKVSMLETLNQQNKKEEEHYTETTMDEPSVVYEKGEEGENQNEQPITTND